MIAEEVSNTSLTESQPGVRVKGSWIKHGITLAQTSSRLSCLRGQYEDFNTLINQILLWLGEMAKAKDLGYCLMHGLHSVIGIPSHLTFKWIIQDSEETRPTLEPPGDSCAQIRKDLPSTRAPRGHFMNLPQLKAEIWPHNPSHCDLNDSWEDWEAGNIGSKPLCISSSPGNSIQARSLHCSGKKDVIENVVFNSFVLKKKLK